MRTPEGFPAFDDCFSDLNQFILELVQAYEAASIKSWDDLEEKVSIFFTAEQIKQISGWDKMASYAGGVTLVHVACVFLGLFMLPEFQSLSPSQKQIAKWTVLFHDVEKEIQQGNRDPIHGFRSAVVTARRLPDFGFPTTSEYADRIDSWSQRTSSAVRGFPEYSEPIQDNQKLPEILAGIERMFGEGTPAALIVKTVLLHMSVNAVTEWPQAAPLTEAEIKTYIGKDLVPLLKVMMLSDNEGWVLFSSEREQQRKDTLEAFQRIERNFSS
jgi:hypothetical protein